MSVKYYGVFLAAVLFFYALGVVIAKNFYIDFFVLTAVFAAFFIVAFILFLKKIDKVYFVFLALFFLLGAIRFTDAATLPKEDISNFAGEEIKITGILVEEPRITEKNEKKRVRYTLEIREIEKSNKRQKASGKIYFYGSYNGEKAKIGDSVEAVANIRKIRPAGNPGAYDRFTHLLCDGITAEAFGGKSGATITEGDEYPLLRKAAEIRKHYKETMESVMSKEDAAAIFAMLFGGYNGLQEELVEAFTLTGIVHILSVSGSHVSMLAAFVAWLGKILRLPQKPLTVLILFVIGFYTLLAGFVPPALRAGIMGCVVFFGTAAERDIDAKRNLTLVALLFLLYNPILLFHISFELSFAATAGILCLMPKLTQKFRDWGLSYALASNFALTTSAQLLTIPVVAYYFHRLSISSLLANLLITPIVEFVIIIGLLTGLIAFIFPFTGKVIFLINSLVLGVVYEGTLLLAKIPFGNIYLPTMGLCLSAVYYMLFIPFMIEDWLRDKLKNIFEPHRKTIGLACVVFALIGLISAFMRQNEVMFAFVDVGQGDAMVVQTPNNHAFMLDTGGTRDGSFDVGARVDVPFLWYHGITELDYIFLTHVHEDHAAGTGGVLKHIPVKEVITANEGIRAYQKSMKVNKSVMEKATFRAANKGDVFMIDGVKVEVLHAPKTARGENEMSNVYRVSYGGASVLVTGDLVKADELKLAASKTNLQSTILKVGHHGSDTSSSPEFLKAVKPLFAVISVGANNSFGHPDEKTIKNLKATKAAIYRTDKDGAVFFYTDGKKLRVEKYFK